MTTLRIATWNLDYVSPGSKQDDTCRAKAAEINADIWVITETFRGFDLGEGFSCAAESEEAIDLESAKRWVMIWVKKPFKGYFKHIPSKDSQRTACAKGVLSDGLEIIVYGTVLPWLGSEWGEVHTKGKQAFLSALQMQKQDWITMQEQQNTLLCVAGDFNQDLLEKGHFYGSNDGREALKNALPLAGFNLYTGGKMDPIASNAPGSANIDHIFVRLPESKALDSMTTSAWTLVQDGARISDHFGISMDILYR